MELGSASLTPYLLDRGLLDPKRVVEGEVQVIEKGRRHLNHQVHWEGAGLFIKQARPDDPVAVSTLQREGCCYYLAGHEKDFEALARLAPNFVTYDRDLQVLIVELVPNAETLAQAFERQRGVDGELARRLGESLGGYHRQSGSGVSARYEPLFPGALPWPLQLDTVSDQGFQSVGPAAVEILRRAQGNPQLVANSRELRSRWQKSCLMHGDLKWDNVLVQHESTGTGTSSTPLLKIIDWEMADLGDPLWDLAGLLQAHVLSWLWSMPLGSGGEMQQVVAQSSAPIEEQRPALRQLWRGYRIGRDFGPKEAEEALKKALDLAALRLLQTALERAVADAGVGAYSLFLLRAAHNILGNPESARRHLGLDYEALNGVKEAA